MHPTTSGTPSYGARYGARARGSPRRAPPGGGRSLAVRLAALALLLTLLASSAAALAQAAPEAVVLGQVPSWPLWIEAGRGLTAAVLAADGSLSWVDGATPDAGPIRIARALAGEQLSACGMALLVVDERGALRRLPRAPDLPVVSAVGPQVSRYHKAACAPDGSVVALDPLGAVLLLSRELEPRARAELAALPDAEPLIVDLGDTLAVAVLSEPTQRYRHGTLGDEVEAAALTLLRLPDLTVLATWRPGAPAVIEARRATPWRSAGAVGLHLTISDDAQGARLISLVWDGAALHLLTQGEPLGASQLWLHLIGAGGEHVYAIHDPRGGGPFVHYRLRFPEAAWGEAAAPAAPALPAAPNAVLETASYDLGLVSHVDGERLLDRALLVGALATGGDLLLVPRADQRTLVWLRCDVGDCREIGEVTLGAALSTNVAASPAQGPVQAVVLADRSGTVWRLPLPLPLADEATPTAPAER